MGLPWVKIIDDHIWMDNKDTIKTFVAKLIYIYIPYCIIHDNTDCSKNCSIAAENTKKFCRSISVPFHGLERPGLWLCGCRRPAYLRGAGVHWSHCLRCSLFDASKRESLPKSTGLQWEIHGHSMLIVDSK